VLVPGMVGGIVTFRLLGKLPTRRKLVTSQTCGKFLFTYCSICQSCSMRLKGYQRRVGAHNAVPKSIYVPNKQSTCTLGQIC
jgi:hypothetical protein